MNPFELVLALVIVVMVTRVIRDRYRFQNQQDGAGRDDAVATQALRDEVQQLRQRIQVLERVITDNHGASDLDREIARLRDER